LNDVDKEHNYQTVLSKELFIDKGQGTLVNESQLPLELSPITLISPHSNSDSEEIRSNSDYDLNQEECISSDSDTTSEYGDLSQFLEFESDVSAVNTKDPFWFVLLLKYLWNGELPLVIAPKLLRKIIGSVKNYTFKNDRLFRRVNYQGHQYEVPYIPQSERYHLALGHMGPNTVIPLLIVRYFWPSLKHDVIEFHAKCNLCQLHGNKKQENRPLHPHQPIGMPFTKWGMDFLQDLPETKSGFKNLFTAKCYATKLVILIPTKDRTAKTVADCIFKGIVCKFGVPLELVSDRASAFMDSVLGEYLNLLEIHHLPSAPYTPRTNGNLERMHRDLNAILTKLCMGEAGKWDLYISQAEFVLNSRKSDATGFSPFYLAHGLDPRIPGDELPIIPPGSVYDFNDAEDVAMYTSKELAILGQNRAAALQRLKTQA
jgi:hypothetical protein